MIYIASFTISKLLYMNNTSLVAQMVKNLPAMWETQVWSLGWEDPLEKGMATYSSILAWKIPWTEEPDWLWSTGSQRVGHDWSDWACRRVGLVLNIPCKFISLKSMWMAQPLAASPGALQNPQDLGHISSRLYLAGLEGNLDFRILKHFPRGV